LGISGVAGVPVPMPNGFIGDVNLARQIFQARQSKL
jgi:hypothetical protein